MTLCKYEVFILTDPQLHWLQCTLPINIYLKKIYIVIYSWLIFLFFLLIANIVYNLVYLFNGKKYLINQINEEKIDDNCLARLRNNIKADGLIVLKLLKSNTSRYYASNIVTNLYQNELKSY
ncbi:unnamed protein product [Brachionus calyciflorus]|uniref:Innexin n=1 Tax=Brachionus calyciflorus TaxID=104777 RepID=A0A814GEE6_9BILA|nr:unnamed protein product [Brachionus calyciflorus]